MPEKMKVEHCASNKKYVFPQKAYKLWRTNYPQVHVLPIPVGVTVSPMKTVEEDLRGEFLFIRWRTLTAFYVNSIRSIILK